MKKSKTIFAVVAVILVIVCLLLVILKPGETQDQTDNTIATTEGNQTESTHPTETPTTPENPNIPTLPEATIPSELPSDTFYFRNNKVVSVAIQDAYTNRTLNYSFGFNTGTCNEVLYLNPVVSPTGGESGFCFVFTPEKGKVLTLPGMEKDENGFNTMTRAIDDSIPATFIDNDHPGTYWHTDNLNCGTTWIDVRVFRRAGDMVATIRLTVEQASDGTYSLTKAENKDMCAAESISNKMTAEELTYFLDIFDTDLHDPAAIYCALDENMNTNANYFVCEWREQGCGTYYNWFTAKGKEILYLKREEYKNTPVIAVSCRFFRTTPTTLTFYYRVDKSPTATQHGVYTLIGYDKLSYLTVEALAMGKYPDYVE